DRGRRLPHALDDGSQRRRRLRVSRSDAFVPGHPLAGGGRRARRADPLAEDGGSGADRVSRRRRTVSYLVSEKTVPSWLLTTDHKRIGVLYLFTTSFFLPLG